MHSAQTDRQTHIHYSFSNKESEALRNEINAERQLCCARVGKGDAGPRQGLCVMRVCFFAWSLRLNEVFMCKCLAQNRPKEKLNKS